MRLKFRNLYQIPRNQAISSLQSSNRSIVIETYDKMENQIQSKPISNSKRTISSNNSQYSSFQKKLKDYKQNLLHLLEKSKNQKECYMKRMIDITNESKSRIGTSRDNYTYSSVSTKYATRTPLAFFSPKLNNQNDQKPNHILRPCKSPQLNNSRLSSKQQFQSSRSKNMKKSRKNSLNSSQNKSSSRSSINYSMNGSVLGPKQMNQTHKLVKRKQELEQELRKLNQNIMLRQKVKSKLTIF